jgi:hypothetical protein
MFLLFRIVQFSLPTTGAAEIIVKRLVKKFQINFWLAELLVRNVEQEHYF